MSGWFEAIRRDLPNMPEEIITLWLAPIAEQKGWPPAMPDLGVWRYVLGIKGLDYWDAVSWSRVEKQLTFDSLSQGSRRTMNGLMGAHVLKEDNEYSNLLNGEKRFWSALSALLQFGAFPQPVILMEEESGLGVVDGNHRVAALVYYRQILKSPEAQKVLPTYAAVLQEHQPAWLGGSPTPGSFVDYSVRAIAARRT